MYNAYHTPSKSSCDILNVKPVLPMPSLRVSVLISAQREEYGPNHNAARHAELGRHLGALQTTWGYGFEEVTGCYKGKEEKSYLVVMESPDFIRTIDFQRLMNSMGYAFEQESILVQNGGGVWLHFMVPALQENIAQHVHIGERLVCVPPTLAHRQDAWTRKADGSYWMVR